MVLYGHSRGVSVVFDVAAGLLAGGALSPSPPFSTATKPVVWLFLLKCRLRWVGVPPGNIYLAKVSAYFMVCLILSWAICQIVIMITIAHFRACVLCVWCVITTQRCIKEASSCLPASSPHSELGACSHAACHQHEQLVVLLLPFAF